MVTVLERSTAQNPGPRRDQAQAMAALCVGGMVVARALADRAYADELRDACMGIALELGGWSNGRKSKSSDNKRTEFAQPLLTAGDRWNELKSAKETLPALPAAASERILTCDWVTIRDIPAPQKLGGDRGEISACLLCLFLLAATPSPRRLRGSPKYLTQIRAEETNNSKIMWIIHEIADVYGPRVTGTPNLKAADDWAVKTMTSWGLANAHLEPWTFQPPSAATPVPGWENMELSADAVAPFHGQLMVMPLAWTPSTKGTSHRASRHAPAARSGAADWRRI